MMISKEKRLEILEHIKSSVDWNRFANYLHSTKNQLNERNERFIASQLRDSIICDGVDFIYIDEKRADIFIKKLNMKVEFKFNSNNGFLYTPASNKRKYTVPEIILVNTLGNNTPKQPNLSPLIVCCEPLCISAVFSEDLVASKKGGQIVAKSTDIKHFNILLDHKDFYIFPIDIDLDKSLEEFKKKQKRNFNDQYKKHMLNYNQNNATMLKQQREKIMEQNKYTNLKKQKKINKKIIIDFLNSEEDMVDLKTISEHLKTKGLIRSPNTYWEYLNELIEEKIIVCETIKERFNKNFYSINKNTPITKLNQKDVSVADNTSYMIIHAESGREIKIPLTQDNLEIVKKSY